MYLFQPIAFASVRNLSIFTFHYVSISTGTCSRGIPVAVKFTFHYVSISTKRINKPTAPPRIFTFHYVSISTKIAALLGDDERNLHSTMYLFQQILLSLCEILRLNLHSTMYLFQQRALVLSSEIHLYLHSTMYLFQL